MLDLRPDRLVKRRVVDFILRQGLHDPESAQIAARLLGEFVRLAVRADFEHALEAIVRLNLAFPGLVSPVAVNLAGVG